MTSAAPEGALSYASRGLPVFPVYKPGGGATGCFCSDRKCTNQAKHPWSKYAPKGSHSATTDATQVTRWWQLQPDANVGIATGGIAHLVVLDIDPDKGGAESLRDLETRHGMLPPTPTVTTGGGGEHYYFRGPEGVEVSNSASHLGPGVDIRGRGGYVVAPPSVHRSGAAYEWQAGASLDEVEIAPIPDWLLALVREQERAPRTSQPADGAPVIEGGRNHYLASLAGGMRRRGMSEVAITAALLAENEARCDPPLADAEVRKIAASIARYEPELDPGPLAPAGGGSAAALEEETPDALNPRKVEAQDGATFILDAPLEVAAVWGSGSEVLWSQGETLIVVSPQGLGKTTMAQQLTLCRMGLRGQFLGYPVSPSMGKVLYLAADRPAQARRSFARMVSEDDRAALAERLIVWPGPLPFDLAKEPASLATFALSLGADTIVVDSLKDVAMDLSKDETGSRVNAAFQTCLAAGLELLVLNHMRKVAGGTKGEVPHVTLDDAYGSIWITSGSGSVFALAGKAGDLIVDVHHLKSPMEQLHSFKVMHDPDRGETTVIDRPDLWTYMQGHLDNGITAEVAASYLYSKDKPTAGEVEKARRKLRDWVRRNLAEEIPGKSGGVGGGVKTVWRLITNTSLSVHGSVHGTPVHGSVHGAFTDGEDESDSDSNERSRSVHGSADAGAFTFPPPLIRGGTGTPPDDGDITSGVEKQMDTAQATRRETLKTAIRDLAQESGWARIERTAGVTIGGTEQGWETWINRADAEMLTDVYNRLAGEASR